MSDFGGKKVKFIRHCVVATCDVGLWRKESYKCLERRRCGRYLHLMRDVEGNSLLSK
jgi:hypothetical protein